MQSRKIENLPFSEKNPIIFTFIQLFAGEFITIEAKISAKHLSNLARECRKVEKELFSEKKY